MFTYTINKKHFCVINLDHQQYALSTDTTGILCNFFFYDFSVNGNDGSTVNRAQGLMIYHRGQLKKSLSIIIDIQCYQSVSYKSSGIFNGIYHKRVLIRQAHNKKRSTAFFTINVVNNDWGHSKVISGNKIHKKNNKKPPKPKTKTKTRLSGKTPFNYPSLLFYINKCAQSTPPSSPPFSLEHKT